MAIVKGEPIANPETVATAIRIGNPASWKTAVAAAEESGGQINYVTDEEILKHTAKSHRVRAFCRARIGCLHRRRL